MAITNSFKLAELVRHLTYDSSTDSILTAKSMTSKDKSRGAATKTATTQFDLDTFAHASFRAAKYIVAMSRGSDFHSTEIMLVHDGSVVTITQYGTLKDASIATFDADISGDNVRLRCTPASTSSSVIKFERILVDA
ncbi:uncharacterized protein METZ01_LOCUS151049 [marine metagenome]|uniref:Uncharacterized protein n=1 Tax=marine metagenome TaxID=408172 RepID=A0A382A9I4_9ZZZZ|tara:strand:+ start:385 stop:795 length:411 start_codon:yes stop_codon:yes gene_type:complete